MKNNKFIASLVIAIVMCIFMLTCFAGCGLFTNSGNQSQSGNTGKTEDPSTNTPKSEFASGAGTQENPYVITQDYQWVNINKHLSAYFELGSDIYLEDLGTIEPIGNTESPFSGYIDGKGYSVSNANISARNQSGLFGVTETATIKNLKFTNSTVAVDVREMNGGFIGSFVGNAKKNTIIENCHTDNVRMNEKSLGNIAIGNPKFYSAGFVGIVQSGTTVRYCSSNVISNADGNRTNWIAGFVGKLDGGTIDASWCSGVFDANPGDVGTRSNNVGGFVYDFLAGNITNVYTEVTFNYVNNVGMFTYNGMDKFEYVLCFPDFANSKQIDERLYVNADVVNPKIASEYVIYCSPSNISQANVILTLDVWASNSLWVQGRLHPELVSYEQYLQITANN